MLIESMVAGAVAVILLVALLRAFSSIWDLNARVREDAESMLVARAVLEAATTRQGLSAKSQEGVVGSYGWGVNISDAPVVLAPEPPKLPSLVKKAVDEDENPDDGDSADKQPKFQLYKVQVVVRAPSGRRTFLDTVKLGPILQ
jgi:type II secretory pathway pseudopilin PulG